MRLVPFPVDNSFRGHKLAPWFLLVVLAVKLTQSLGVLLGGRSIVSAADGIPLDTYAFAPTQTILALFTLVSFDRLLVVLVSLLVLVRYRSLVPLALAALLLQDAGKFIILSVSPMVRVGTPAGPRVNLLLLALLAVGFALSLWSTPSTHTEISRPSAGS
jgi:hypothetical protein